MRTAPGRSFGSPLGMPAFARPAPRASRAPESETWSLKAEIKALLEPRFVLAAWLLLTYIWRYHTMAPLLEALRLAAVATVLSWGVLLIWPKMNQLLAAFRKPYVALLFLWVLWMGLTVPMSIVPERSWDIWFNGVLKTLSMFLLLLTCFTSLKYVRGLMAVNVIGAATLVYFYTKAGYPLWGSPVTMLDVNDMALHLSMVLPMMLFFAMTIPNWKVQVLFWVLSAMTAVCVLMTQSRGGFLTIGVLFIFLIIRAKDIKIWVRMLPFVALVVGFFFLPAPEQERLSTLFSPTEDYNYTDEGGRVEIWRRGLQTLSGHPVAGIGLSNFVIADGMSTGKPGRAPHNSFVQAAVETGYTGIVLFAGSILSALFALFRIRSRMASRRDPQAITLARYADCLTMSLLAYCVGGFFLTQAIAPILFTVIALIAGLDLAASRRPPVGRSRPRQVRHTAPPSFPRPVTTGRAS